MRTAAQHVDEAAEVAELHRYYYLENTGGGVICLVVYSDGSDLVDVVGEDVYDVATYTREGWVNGDEPVQVRAAENMHDALEVLFENDDRRLKDLM